MAIAGPSQRDPLWADLREGFGRWHLWFNLAWKDIRSRYRRTVIGPFWTVLSTATLVEALGFVNATLWHVQISVYLPFFCAGYIAWLLFITIVNESGSSLIAAEASIKAIRIPYSVFVLRVLTRNLIVFGHNLLVFALVFPAGLGMGDAKVGFLLGFALGWRTISAMMLAFFGLFLAALWTISRHGLTARSKSLPFGPFLAFGAIVAFFLT